MLQQDILISVIKCLVLKYLFVCFPLSNLWRFNNFLPLFFFVFTALRIGWRPQEERVSGWSLQLHAEKRCVAAAHVGTFFFLLHQEHPISSKSYLVMLYLLDLSQPEPSARLDNYIKRMIALLLLLLRPTHNTAPSSHLSLGWVGSLFMSDMIASWCHNHWFPGFY